MAEELPFWVYKSLLVGNRRENHVSLHNTARRHDDPFWDSYYPPNGWNCACEVLAADEQTMEERGYRTVQGAAPRRFAQTVPPEWRSNPGLHAFAPDFSTMKALQEKGVLKHIKESYIADLEKTALTRSEFVRFMRVVEEKQHHAQGIQIPVGTLSMNTLSSFEEAGYMIDPKIILTDKAVAHSIRNTKPISQRLRSEDHADFYDVLRRPERIIETEDRGQRAFRFLGRGDEHMIKSEFHLAEDGRGLVFRTAARISEKGQETNKVRDIQ